LLGIMCWGQTRGRGEGGSKIYVYIAFVRVCAKVRRRDGVWEGVREDARKGTWRVKEGLEGGESAC